MSPQNNRLRHERIVSHNHEESLSMDDSTSNTILEELRLLSKLSFPIILMSLFRYANPVISIIMCGRLTKTEFDASSLANSIINVFGISIDLGFSTSCDTLFSRTFGGKNKKKMGFILQRTIIVMTILYLLLACLHMNIEPMLVLLQQDFKILRLTSKYVLIYLPGLFFDFQFLAISRYLQNQNIVLPMMISALCGSIFNLISQYIAIRVLGFGIEASSFLQGFSCFVMFSIQLLYVLISKVYISTWQGFDLIEALSDWKIFFALGIPGIVMLSVEQWSYEAVNFIAGAYNEVQLGGHTIAFQVEVLFICISSGFGIGVLIRVGQNLGANNVRSTKNAIKVAFTFSLTMSILSALLIGFGRTIISNIFTDKRDIQLVGERLLCLIAVFQIFDAVNCIFGGVLRACGKQFLGAVIMTITYFAIGIPIGIIIMKFAHIDIMGMWLGLLAGYIVETILFTIFIFRINWKKEAEKVLLNTPKHQYNRDEIFEETDLDISEDNEEIIDINPVEEKESSFLLKSKRSNQLSSLAKRKLIRTRILQLSCVLLVFTLSVLIKIFLHPSIFIPCIPNYNNNSSWFQTLRSKNYPMCNDTSVFN